MNLSANKVLNQPTSQTMKVLTLFVFIAGFLASANHGLAAFSVDWSTLDGGGAVSVGDSFTLGGTIGQPDAGLASGGPFTLVGGFWGGAYQGPKPSLSITLAGSQVVLRWPAWATGWTPLTANSLTPGTPWAAVSETPVASGSEFTLTLPASANAQFFRLWLR